MSDTPSPQNADERRLDDLRSESDRRFNELREDIRGLRDAIGDLGVQRGGIASDVLGLRDAIGEAKSLLERMDNRLREIEQKYVPREAHDKLAIDFTRQSGSLSTAARMLWLAYGALGTGVVAGIGHMLTHH